MYFFYVINQLEKYGVILDTICTFFMFQHIWYVSSF